MRLFILCKKFLAANSFYISYITDLKYYYKLLLIKKSSIIAKPSYLKHQEEVWLDVHLDKLITK